MGSSNFVFEIKEITDDNIELIGSGFSTSSNDGENNKFCSNCGAKLDKDSKFCSSCGTKVE